MANRGLRGPEGYQLGHLHELALKAGLLATGDVMSKKRRNSVERQQAWITQHQIEPVLEPMIQEDIGIEPGIQAA